MVVRLHNGRIRELEDPDIKLDIFIIMESVPKEPVEMHVLVEMTRIVREQLKQLDEL